MVSLITFWSKALGMEAARFGIPNFEVSTSGAYVKKHGDQYVFAFRDLNSGKTVLAGTSSSMRKLDAAGKIPKVLSEAKPLFNDLDFGLLFEDQFKPRHSRKVRRVTEANRAVIDMFLAECSEDDRDTLDLTFEGDTAFAIYDGPKIQGIARYVPAKTCPAIADITVLVAPLARGKGYSSFLVSEVVADLLANNLTPKYRVAADNLPSIATAKRLGFLPMFEFKSWETSSLF